MQLETRSELSLQRTQNRGVRASSPNALTFTGAPVKFKVLFQLLEDQNFSGENAEPRTNVTITGQKLPNWEVQTEPE